MAVHDLLKGREYNRNKAMVTKLMGAFVTFWDNDAGSKTHLLANPGQDVAPIGAARQEDSLLESQMQLGSLQYLDNLMKGASEHFHIRPLVGR